MPPDLDLMHIGCSCRRKKLVTSSGLYRKRGFILEFVVIWLPVASPFCQCLHLAIYPRYKADEIDESPFCSRLVPPATAAESGISSCLIPTLVSSPFTAVGRFLKYRLWSARPCSRLLGVSALYTVLYSEIKILCFVVLVR